MNAPTPRALLTLTATGCMVVGLGLASCAAPKIESGDPPQQHAYQGARMRQAMMELRELSQGRVTQELDPEAEQRKIQALVAEIAEAIGKAAEAIPDVLTEDLLTEHDLSADEREHFIELAEDLETQSRALAGDAQSLTWPQLQDRVREMSVSCNDCHSCFRDLPNIDPNPTDQLR